jgi:hypothetical protein
VHCKVKNTTKVVTSTSHNKTTPEACDASPVVCCEQEIVPNSVVVLPLQVKNKPAQQIYTNQLAQVDVVNTNLCENIKLTDTCSDSVSELDDFPLGATYEMFTDVMQVNPGVVDIRRSDEKRSKTKITDASVQPKPITVKRKQEDQLRNKSSPVKQLIKLLKVYDTLPDATITQGLWKFLVVTMLGSSIVMDTS